jgi:DNA-directed RNA polymerase subunit RPC12/RpoP
LETVTAQLAAELYTADRNYLLLELRRITLGDLLPAWYSCPRCGAEVSLDQDLGAVPVRRLAEDQTPTDLIIHLADGYLDREGKSHYEVVLSMPRGVDEEFVSTLAETDPLRAQDVLLLRCIRRFGSLPAAALEAYGIKVLRDLTMGDRRLLFEGVNSQMPGVDFRYPVRCAECGNSFQGVMDVSGFFV